METLKKEEKQMPARQIRIKIGQADYDIKMPLKNGDTIDISAAKIRISGGTFKDLPYGGFDSQRAYILVEAIATFEILIPTLRIDLNVGSLVELDALQSKYFLKEYERYYALADEWNKYLNQDFAIEKKDKE